MLYSNQVLLEKRENEMYCSHIHLCRVSLNHHTHYMEVCRETVRQFSSWAVWVWAEIPSKIILMRGLAYSIHSSSVSS